MKIKLLPLAVSALIAAPAFAEPTLYGKANVSYEYVDDGNDSTSELTNNASRIGVKGSEELESGYQIIYQAEFGVDWDDGDTFSQRNIFIGLKGDFGLVKAGHFDTPLKTAQKKVDLFNDLAGDIKNIITVNDNRVSNIVSYTTPAMGAIEGQFAVVNSEDADVDNGFSGSLAFEQDGLYLAAAMDSGVEDIAKGGFVDTTTAVRLVGQYQFSDFQVGALYESFDNGADSENGWLVSGKYSLDKLALKAQFGQSDIDEQGGETVSIGADYKLAKPAKVFAYLTAIESDEGTDDTVLGAGVEYKF